MTEFDQLIAENDPEIQDWARQARDLVLKVRPDATQQVETCWGGYLLFKQPVKDGNTVCWVSAYKKHVSIGFPQGAEMSDPAGLLEGSGKMQRHVKIKKATELESSELRDLIQHAWDRQPSTEVIEQSLERVRALCLSWPEVSETISHGHPTFKAGKKSFAVCGIYSPSVAFKADFQLQASLEGDERFFPTPYMAHRGWLSLHLNEETDWELVGEMLEHSYRQVATKTMKAKL